MARTEPMSETEIATCIRRSLDRYFKDLDGEDASGIFNMVIGSVEKPMLIAVMKHAEGNQTRAAEMLGINRNTLRNKLREYDLV
jgi:Fis family transcriptional regulator